MAEFHDYLIVGAGLAGAAAARGIRELDGGGSILLLGEEPDPPYHRPPLSKGLWLGKESVDGIAYQTADDWRALDVRMHLGDAVVALDAARKELATAGGARFAYRKLLLATGGRARALNVPEAARERVHVLRTLSDYLRLRELARDGGTVLVIGGSFIGAEMACALAAQPGVSVSMVFPGPGPLAQILPQPLTRVVADLYRAHGVRLYAEDRVVELAARGDGLLARTERGEQIEAGWALAGVGLELATALAQMAGLEVANGVRVNAHLQTSHPDIYAAGDLASYPDPVWGELIRPEHWDNALAAGRAAGRNMAGASETFRHQSMFFSDLFDIGFEAVGTLSSRLETYVDMAADLNKGVIYYLRQNQVCGVLLWNTWEQVDAARELIAARQSVWPADLKGRLS